ncbi:MAG: regulatory protein RecX [Halopseudomonas yangmingensis]|uniref:Regulatory protein RecX n=1 Tax=Halopseudomonas yangmingensis TaxID=1720063 RepID=A0A1I4U7F7_9GAMM|nr:regulatory protein RecX [Halopseudomonas yangmingensis]SFM84892.1 regulatory protein [Halopseudomonas yangmingensis]
MFSRKPLETPLAVRRAAMDLLARREHSRAELLRKLQPRVSARSLLDAELDRLEEDGLLSDARFCEAYVHARSQRGIGPQRLREELRLRGVGSALVERVLQDQQWDWAALEAQVFAKRFPEGRASEPRERARQLRFMQYRGF